jgi:flagellar hook protein FlgE
MFDTGISGLQAASTDLSVIGNNVANASSSGFKASRAQFADVYAANSASNAVGMGTTVAGVDQIFTQGSLTITNNTLDLAIQDGGFFGLSDNGVMVYTRAGAFNADTDGYVVNNAGQRLTGFLGDGLGGVSGQRGELRIDTSMAPPKTTSQVAAAMNLRASSVAPTTAWTQDYAFGDTPPAAGTYNNSTSMSIYDNLGNSHELSLYFVMKDATADPTLANTWDVHALIDGVTVRAGDAAVGAPAGTVAFDRVTGKIASGSEIQINGWQPLNSIGGINGAPPSNFTISLDGSTQYASPFNVSSMTQDGCTAGNLTRIGIDGSGTITTYYSNNQSRALGQVGLYNFTNQQGLKQLGNTTWGATLDSGGAQIGVPGTGSLGTIKSGALEQSNVDVTAELVRLILAQRNYQANAQTIAADDKVTQTILNIR